MNDPEARPQVSPWERLDTEASGEEFPDLDRLAPSELVALLLEEDRRGLERALASVPELAEASRWWAETYGSGGRVLLLGAGTSGRLGVLEAAECPPTFGTEPDRIVAVIAGGPGAVFRAVEGAEDRIEDGRSAAAVLESGDLLLAISASSVTPFVRGALEEARLRGAKSVLLTCVRREQAGESADLVIALATGPEVLTGSTRLKAGSVTKAALNAISTAAMVRLGKVYRRWMVDLRPGSAKLRDRALRILQAASGVDRERAVEALDAAGGEVKVALVALRLGCSAARAHELLAREGGDLRAVLDVAGGSGTNAAG